MLEGKGKKSQRHQQLFAASEEVRQRIVFRMHGSGNIYRTLHVCVVHIEM